MRNTDAPIQLLAHTSTFLGPWRKRALLSTALHKKSWAVIDHPYSLGCATVGALYERPRCIFCAKRSGRAKTRQETRALIRWRVFVSAQPGRNDREDSGDQRRAMGRYQLYGLRLQ